MKRQVHACWSLALSVTVGIKNTRKNILCQRRLFLGYTGKENSRKQTKNKESHMWLFFLFWKLPGSQPGPCCSFFFPGPWISHNHLLLLYWFSRINEVEMTSLSCHQLVNLILCWTYSPWHPPVRTRLPSTCTRHVWDPFLSCLSQEDTTRGGIFSHVLCQSLLPWRPISFSHPRWTPATILQRCFPSPIVFIFLFFFLKTFYLIF